MTRSSATVVVLSHALIAAVGLLFIAWLRLNQAHSTEADRNAREFTKQLSPNELVFPRCDSSVFSSSEECSFVASGHAVLFRCDERDCRLMCEASK